MKNALLAVLALACGLAHAQERPARFYGFTYDLASGKYLYTEVHDRKYEGARWVGGTTRYFKPDGTALATKTLDFATDPFVPVYRLDETAASYVEGITSAGDPIAMTRQEGRGSVEAGAVKRDGAMTADAGFTTLLRAHFDALMKGETVRFRVVAVSRFDSFKFRAQRVADTAIEGKPAAVIEALVDSMLKLFAAPLQFAFDPATQRLLEYRGPSNLRDPATGKTWDVRIAYYGTPPKDVKLPSLNPP